jgi:predicted enzyme related to lactoylglutathione lyase
MGRPVAHFEIGAADGERSGAFYRALFGWEVHMNPLGCGTVDTCAEGSINGGIMRTPEGVPAFVTLYVAVDDVESSLHRAEALGANAIMLPMSRGPMGSFAMFADLDGNLIGLFAESGSSEAVHGFPDRTGERVTGTSRRGFG